MKVTSGLLAGILCAFALAQADPRVWGPQGVAVRQGEYIRWEESTARDGSGNTLIVWTDKRTGDRDVRAQLINGNGTELWPAGGINVTQEMHHQDRPVAVSVTGGWVIAWADFRRDCLQSGNCGDVYAQKLDYSGNRLWSDNDFTGVAVDVADRWIAKYSVRVVHDGAGGAIIAWCDGRTDGDVYAQRVTAQGDIAWNPVLPVTNHGSVWEFGAAEDNAGGMIVAFSWYPNEDIHALRISPDGDFLWGEDGVLVCGAQGSQNAVRVIPDGWGGGYFVWRDGRSGSWSLYAQRLDEAGDPWWADNGIPVCNTPEYRGVYDMSLDQANGVPQGLIVVWEEPGPDQWNYEIYGQKISEEGTAVWAENGIRLAGDYTQYHCRQPDVTSDRNGGLVCVWEDTRDHVNLWERSTVYATRYNASGEEVWPAGGVPVADTERIQHNPVIVGDFGTYLVTYQDWNPENSQSLSRQLLNHADGTRLLGQQGAEVLYGIDGWCSNAAVAPMGGHRTAILWEDTRTGFNGNAVYYQIIGPSGEMERTRNGERIAPNNTGNSYIDQNRVETCDDGNGGVFVSFADIRWGTRLVRMAHIDEAGDVVSPDSGVVVWWPTYDQERGFVAPDGEGGCYVAWSGYAPNFWLDIWVMRLNAQLERVWTQPTRLTESWPDDIVAQVVTTDGGCMVVWQSGNYDDYNVTAARVSADGSVAWNDTLCAAPNDQDDITATADGAGGMYLAWRDRRSDGSGDIYAQRVNAAGIPYWEENGIAICDANDHQWEVQLALDSRGDLYVLWEDYRDGDPTKAYAQKVSPSGEMRWADNGVLVSTADYSDHLELVASTGRNGVLPIWTDSRYAWIAGLYATHLDSTGGVYPDPFWVPDSGGWIGHSRTSRQLNPAAASDGWGGAVVAWEEWYTEFGEEGEYTPDIYVQRLFDYPSGAGEPADPLPTVYALYQNYPNPFNPLTTIAFDLPQANKVRLAVYDLLGREVATMVDRAMPAGQHTVTFDATNLPSGLYIYRLTAGDFAQSHKLVLLR